MRERFDFASISAIILENSKQDSFKQEYFYLLFDYAFTQDEIKISITDESNISRILKRDRSVPKDIVTLYQDTRHFKHLQDGVSKVLNEVFDVVGVKEQVYHLLMDDVTMSMSKRKELAEDKEDALLFLTNCILAGMTRSNTKKKQAGKEFDISDYLLDYHYPRSNKEFFGRDLELEMIHRLLNEEPHLFLYGIGGIGKSELAKHYGEKFKKEYDQVLYLRYADSLYQTICELTFIDDKADMSDDELFHMHIRFFKQLTTNTLVILDNFNKLLEEDEVLQDFLSMSFQLLVTTRSKIEEAECYQVKEIKSLEALENLFYTYAPIGKASPDIVRNIIEEVYRHTLTVEIAAKTVSAADLTTIALLEALRTDRLNLSSPNKVRVLKDASIKKATPKEHLARLFQIQNLPNEYRATLQHMRLIPDGGIPKGLFCKWMGAEDFNMVNDLIDYGWLQEDVETRRISLHPFLNEVLGIYEQPSFRKCQRFIESLGQEYIAEPENEIFYRDLLGLTKSIFKKIQIDDTLMEFRLLERILTYLEKYMYQNTMEYMLRVYEKTVPMDEEHKMETATYQFYKGIHILKKGGIETAMEYLKNGISVLEPIDKSNVSLAINLYNKLSACYMLRNNPELNQKCMEKVIELRQLYHLEDGIDYEFEKVMHMLASRSNEPDKSNELEEVLKTPELTSFLQNAGKFSLSRKEFQKDIEKIEPDELPDGISPLIESIKQDLRNTDFAEHEEISAFDMLMGVFNSVINHVGKNDEKK